MKLSKEIGMLAVLTCASACFAQRTATNRDWTDPDMHGRFGGGVYTGNPRLDVTASLIAAGGVVDTFSIRRALESMEGRGWVRGEYQNLEDLYGRKPVEQWERTFDFTVTAAAKRRGDIAELMGESHMRGRRLAMALVNAGIDIDHRFTSEVFCDRLYSHPVHEKVMDDVEKDYGTDADGDFHRISNRLFFDLASHLGMSQIQLATYH